MQSADKGQTAHGSDLHLFRGHVWRGSVGHDEVKDKMSAVVKALRSILAPSRDCSSDVLYGDTGLLPGVLIDAAKLCWQRSRTWRLADGEALRFSFEGSRGVGRPKVGTDCGNVKSITEQIQHT
jgi:hypothetical protein